MTNGAADALIRSGDGSVVVAKHFFHVGAVGIVTGNAGEFFFWVKRIMGHRNGVPLYRMATHVVLHFVVAFKAQFISHFAQVRGLTVGIVVV